MDQAAEWTLDHVVDGELSRVAAVFGEVQCAVSTGDSRTEVFVRSQVVVSTVAQQKKLRVAAQCTRRTYSFRSDTLSRQLRDLSEKRTKLKILNHLLLEHFFIVNQILIEK